MQVLVSDTSVLVDLEHGALLQAAFRLPFRFSVPDLLFQRELKDHGGVELLQLGLCVVELDGICVTRALSYRQRVQALTLPDSFALALAQANAWILVTGDGPLRKLAAAEAVECHGVLWMLDQMHLANVASPQDLHNGLKAIAAHPRCRLPAPEVKQRLTTYAVGSA
jgi:predicted nucleic acid-binding protein